MSSDPTRAVLLRSMAAVAAADGAVGDAELDSIAGIYREVTGEEVPMDELREIVEAGWSGGADPAGFVASVGADQSRETRLAVARACYRVLASDGEITGPEVHTFNAVVDGLGLSRKDVVDRL